MTQRDDEDAADGHAGLGKRNDDVTERLQPVAPASRAASISDLSMRISVLKIGVTMNSV